MKTSTLIPRREQCQTLCLVGRWKGAKNNEVGHGEINSKARNHRKEFSREYVGVVGKNYERCCCDNHCKDA
jgi:hypothetical protein